MSNKPNDSLPLGPEAPAAKVELLETKSPLIDEGVSAIRNKVNSVSGREGVDDLLEEAENLCQGNGAMFEIFKEVGDKKGRRSMLALMDLQSRYKFGSVEWFKALANLFLMDDKNRVVELREKGKYKEIMALWDATPAFKENMEIFEAFLTFAEEGAFPKINHLLDSMDLYEDDIEKFRSMLDLAKMVNLKKW